MSLENIKIIKLDDNTYLKRILTILPATQMISKQLLRS